MDLFCGAGGAAMGYHRAGFDIVGVDIEPQPRYPFEFVQADAMTWIADRHFDAFHASPPCQRYTGMNNRFPDAQAQHPDLIAQVRAAFRTTDRPYVIENVIGARRELDHPIVICGRAVGLRLARHRLFECSFPAMSLQCQCNGHEIPVYGKHHDGRLLWTRTNGSELRAPTSLDTASRAMGIDWMTWDELREAIPPAYTEHVGGYLMRAARRLATVPSGVPAAPHDDDEEH